jgi:hypothetical protein
MNTDVTIASEKGFLLSEAEIAEIRELHSGQQYSYSRLARMFHVEEREIKIILGKKRAKR